MTSCFKIKVLFDVLTDKNLKKIKLINNYYS